MVVKWVLTLDQSIASDRLGCDGWGIYLWNIFLYLSILLCHLVPSIAQYMTTELRDPWNVHSISIPSRADDQIHLSWSLSVHIVVGSKQYEKLHSRHHELSSHTNTNSGCHSSTSLPLNICHVAFVMILMCVQQNLSPSSSMDTFLLTNNANAKTLPSLPDQLHRSRRSPRLVTHCWGAVRLQGFLTSCLIQLIHWVIDHWGLSRGGFTVNKRGCGLN